MSICGAVAALGGMSVYTSLSLSKEKASTNLLPKQNPSPLKPKSAEDDIDQMNIADTSSVV